MTVSLPSGVQVIERGWLSANLVIASGRVTSLIDTGYVTHREQTLQLVRAGLGGQSPALLLNTHLHSDHCGGNAALQAAYPHLRTLIPPGHAEAVKTWDEEALSYRPTGQNCPRFRFDAVLQPGEDIVLGEHVWQVHAAPGHDPHSVILFEPLTRTLVSADALWENGFGVVFPELEGEHAFADVARTLDLIESLEPRTVIPGHGAVFGMRAEVLQRARQRLAAFIEDPIRHAQHAAKVLLKYKLLEVQAQDRAAFLDWAEGVRYLQGLQQRHFPDRPLRHWLDQLLDDLVRVGAAEASGEQIRNR